MAKYEQAYTTSADVLRMFISSRWSPWISRFNDLHYSCMAIDVDCESGRLEDFETGQSPYHTFGLLAADTNSLTYAELKKQLRQSSSPFPPLLFAYGLNTLIAQTYVSSHPLSGLVLVDPPLSIAYVSKSRKDLLKGQHQEFDYEPFFPIAILGNRKRAEELEQHRLRRDFSEEVHLLVTPDEEVIADDGFERVKDWMDSNGL